MGKVLPLEEQSNILHWGREALTPSEYAKLTLALHQMDQGSTVNRLAAMITAKHLTGKVLDHLKQKAAAEDTPTPPLS